MDFVKRKYRGLKYRFLRKFGTPKQLADYLYYLDFGKKINWKHPEDLNQWINWLAYNTDTTEWSRLSDKYGVREYIRECGLEDTLVPLLAVWEKPEDIDFTNLPDQFVIKANNGSGDVKIIKDKSQANLQQIQEYFRNLFSHPFGIDSAEPHYLRIKPRIVAEALLDASKQATPSSSLIDYKVWCINGEPIVIWIALNRTPHHLEMSAYTPAWKKCIDKLKVSDHYRGYQGDINKPQNLDQILNFARILSKKFPEVRIDFYEVDNKVYFGEMTFTSACGRMTYFTPKALKEMGDSISLS